MSRFNKTTPPFVNDVGASSPTNETSTLAELTDGWAWYSAQSPVEFTTHIPSVPAGPMRGTGVGNLSVNYYSFVDGGIPTMPAGHSAPVAWSDAFMHGNMNPVPLVPDTYDASRATMHSSPGVTAHTGIVNGVGLSTSIHTDMPLHIMYPDLDATLSDASIGHSGVHEQWTSGEVYAMPRPTMRLMPRTALYADAAGSGMPIVAERYDVSQPPAFAGGTLLSTYIESQPVRDSYLAPPTTPCTGVGVYDRNTHISAFANVHSAPQPLAGPAGCHTDSRVNAHSAPMSTFAETYVVSPPPACAEPRTTMYDGVSGGGSSIPHSTLSAGQYSVSQPGAYPERRPDIFDDGSRTTMPTHVNVDGISEPVAYSMPSTTLSTGPTSSDGQYGVFQPGVYLECRPDVFNDGSCTTMPTHANEHGAPAYPMHRPLPPAGLLGAHISPRANARSAPQTTNLSHGTLALACSTDSADGSKVARHCPWANCDLLLDQSVGGVRRHFRGHHLKQTDPNFMYRCQCDGCEKEMKFSSLPRHVVDIHWRGLRVSCPRCKKKYTRGDSRDRHTCSG